LWKFKLLSKTGYVQTALPSWVSDWHPCPGPDRYGKKTSGQESEQAMYTMPCSGRRKLKGWLLIPCGGKTAQSVPVSLPGFRIGRIPVPVGLYGIPGADQENQPFISFQHFCSHPADVHVHARHTGIL